MDERQIEILETTTRLFQKYGLKFTLNDVASTMHIAKKTIYQYYPSKEDLLIGLLDYGFGKIHAKKSSIIASELSLPEKLSAAMIAMPDQYQVLDFRMLSSLAEKYPRADAALKRYLASDWEPIIALLEEGMEAGVFRPVSIVVLKTMVTSSIEGLIATQELKENNIPYQKALEELMEIIMGGILQ